MVLVGFDSESETPCVQLRDPSAEEGAFLTIDQIRFEDAWTGDVILIRRDYDITDEEQPFSIGLISSLVFRERRLVRDLVICALILSFFALAPIMFWRLLSDKVIYYGSLNTFTVLCVGMLLVIVVRDDFCLPAILSDPDHYRAGRHSPLGIHVRQGSAPADRLLRAHAGRHHRPRHE